MPVNHQSHLSKCPATSAKSTAKTVLASVQGHPGLHLTCTISYCAPRSGLYDHRFIQSCHWVIDAVLGGHAKLVALFLKAAGLSHHVTRKVAQPSSKWLIRDKMFSFSTLQMLGQSCLQVYFICTIFTLNLPPLQQFSCVVQFITFCGERSWEWFSFHKLLLLPRKRRAAAYGEPFSPQCGDLFHQTICGEMFLWEENPKFVFPSPILTGDRGSNPSSAAYVKSLGKILSSTSPWRPSSPKYHPPQCEESTAISVSQSPKGSQDRA